MSNKVVLIWLFFFILFMVGGYVASYILVYLLNSIALSFYSILASSFLNSCVFTVMYFHMWKNKK